MKRPNLDILIVGVTMGFMFLIAGACAPAYAQEGKHEQDARPEKQEQPQARGQQEHQQQAKEQQDHQQQVKGQQEHQQEVKSQQEHQQAKGLQKQLQVKSVKKEQQQSNGLQKQQQAKPASQPQVKPVSQTQQQTKVSLKKQQANQPSQPVQHVAQAEQKTVWQQHRAQNWQADHRTWQDRGGYVGYRIPEDHYSGHFGQYHSFRIYSHSMEIYDGYPRFQYNGYWFGVLDPWPESWSDDWYENDDVYIIYSNDGYYMFNRRHPGVGIAINVYLN
jgi:hypothetical protein